jgi:RNA polymerase sigma-70 factor (ECF subfamily)
MDLSHHGKPAAEAAAGPAPISPVRPDLMNAFVEIQDALKNYLQSLLNSQAEAEDALQETFLIVRGYIGTYDDQRDFAKWVRGIARNVVLRMRRTLAKDRSLSIEQVQDTELMVADSAPQENRLTANSEIGAVRAWLAQLTAEQQRTVLLRYVDRLGVDQIAKEMAKSEAAVYMALSRIRGSLQHYIQRQRRLATAGPNGSASALEPIQTPADEADTTTLALRLLVTGMGLGKGTASH